MKRYTAIEICAVFDEGKQEGFLLKMLKEGPNQAKIPRKRIKFQEVMEKEEEDGISALPDCLILEILCRLPSTKDAIRTGTLSKRWANLWTWVPTLLFRHFDIPLSQCLKNPNSRSNFPLLVEKTLTQCRQLKLKKFQMHTKYDIRFEAQFNNCIRHAVRCNVEKLSLEFLYTRREAEFQLDQFFFVNSCFTDLRLVGCTLNPSGAVSWKNLKSLCISTKNLDVDVMVNILSGSPLVETLVLKDCYGDTGLNITSDDESESESEAHIIGINAPNSSSLSQCRQLQLKKFTVVSDFDNEFQSQLNSWIRYAIRCNVKEIVLILWNTGFESELTLDQTLVTNSCLTELRLDGCMVNPIGAISWRSLRSLYISYRSLDEDLIENILSGSPVLVTLELNDCYGHRRLDITSKSVKNLVLSGFSDFYDESVANIIEINAPNILSLTIKHVLLSKLLLVNVSSLVKANLNYVFPSPRHHPTMTKEAEQDTLKGFIMNLGHVKELQIGYLCSEIMIPQYPIPLTDSIPSKNSYEPNTPSVSLMKGVEVEDYSKKPLAKKSELNNTSIQNSDFESDSNVVKGGNKTGSKVEITDLRNGNETAPGITDSDSNVICEPQLQVTEKDSISTGTHSDSVVLQNGNVTNTLLESDLQFLGKESGCVSMAKENDVMDGKDATNWNV